MKQLISSIFSRLDYCNAPLIGLPFSTIAPSQRVQNAAARLLLELSRRDHVYGQPRRSFNGCPSCTESSASWHWWCSQSTHAAAQTTSAILCRRVTVIRHGLVFARRPAATTLFHGQERDLATEPSAWPAHLYGTVYQQQFVKLTACIRLLGAQAQNTSVYFVLMTD